LEDIFSPHYKTTNILHKPLVRVNSLNFVSGTAQRSQSHTHIQSVAHGAKRQTPLMLAQSSQQQFTGLKEYQTVQLGPLYAQLEDLVVHYLPSQPILLSVLDHLEQVHRL